MNRELKISSIELVDIELYKASIDNLNTKAYESFRYLYSVDFTVFIASDVIGVIWDIDYLIDTDNGEENSNKPRKAEEDDADKVGNFVFNFFYNVNNVQDFLEPSNENTEEAFIIKKLYYYILDNSYNVIKGLIWGLTQGTALANSFLPSCDPIDIYDYHSAALLTINSDRDGS